MIPDSFRRSINSDDAFSHGTGRKWSACLIVLIILLILGITLIYRKVKDSCLHLGIMFFIYGVIMFAAVLVGKNFALKQFPLMDIPQSLSNLPGILLIICQLAVTNCESGLSDWRNCTDCRCYCLSEIKS